MRNFTSKIIGGIIATVAAVAISLAAATAANAVDPITFSGSQISDPGGVLGDQLRDVENALKETQNATGRQLFVVFVDNFTNPNTGQAWANATAAASSLGKEDYVLAVAVKARKYGLYVGAGSTLNPTQYTDLASQYIEPKLANNDWAGAAIAGAQAINKAKASVNSGSNSTQSSETGSGAWSFIGFLVVAGIAIVALLFFFARRKARSLAAAGGASRIGNGQAYGDDNGGPWPAQDGATPQVPPPPSSADLEKLKRKAGSALVAADDAIKTSEDELGFAIAAYGESATKQFRDALENAKKKLIEAFALQQKIDDDIPDTDEDRYNWYTSIIALTSESGAELDRESAEFDKLRSLETNAPSAISHAESLLETANTSLAPAAETLAMLKAKYAATALSSVIDNPIQASDRISFARNNLDEAKKALNDGKKSEAAMRIRAAEEAADQANLLVNAISRLEKDLVAAEQGISGALAEVDDGIARAAGTSNPTVAKIAEQTTQQLAKIRAAIDSGDHDPLALHSRLIALDSELDKALDTARSEQEQDSRDRAHLDRTLTTAQAQVQGVNDYIVARRGAVGPEARTRLAEATRLVEDAVVKSRTDLDGALQSAQRAVDLASSAQQLAQQDVERFDGNGMGGGMFVGGRGGGGNNILGAVLGGILVSGLFNGNGGNGGGGGIFGGGGGGGGGDWFSGGFGGGGGGEGSF